MLTKNCSAKNLGGHSFIKIIACNKYVKDYASYIITLFINY